MKKNLLHEIKNLAMIVVAALIYAVGISLFLESLNWHVRIMSKQFVWMCLEEICQPKEPI